VFPVDPMHAARLANLEGAACALLRAASRDHDANDAPDGIVIRLQGGEFDIEYTRGRFPIAGESL